jgi:hypothetical protein
MSRKPKKHTLDDVLKADDRLAKHTYGQNGILASLFRILLADYKIGHIKWAQCMDRYLRDPRNKVGVSTKEKTSMRGNIAKELLNDQMTWKVFCKGLVFLQFYRVRFFVEITDPLGRARMHGLPVNFGLPDLDDDDAPQSEDDKHERSSEEKPGDDGPGTTSTHGGRHDE